MDKQKLNEVEDHIRSAMKDYMIKPNDWGIGFSHSLGWYSDHQANPVCCPMAAVILSAREQVCYIDCASKAAAEILGVSREFVKGFIDGFDYVEYNITDLPEGDQTEGFCMGLNLREEWEDARG